MKQMLRKLKSKAGESLVESLAAILIFTMASIILFSMVTTAGDINTRAKEKDLENQQQMVAVEKGEASYKTGTGEITFTLIKEAASGAAAETVPLGEATVDIYGGEDGELYSYFKSAGGT